LRIVSQDIASISPLPWESRVKCTNSSFAYAHAVFARLYGSKLLIIRMEDDAIASSSGVSPTPKVENAHAVLDRP